MKIVKSLLLPLAAAGLLCGQNAGNWLTYSGNDAGHRYSNLNQITKANAARLRPLWVYQIDKTDKFEASPIVRDRIMYISEPPSDVTALDTSRAACSGSTSAYCRMTCRSAAAR